MSGLVEQWAEQIGWAIGLCTVIVEGTSDVRLLLRASDLYMAKYSAPLIDAKFGVVAAGRGDDGGVEGVNRRLTAARQIADADRSADGALRYKFIGLFDNDEAGRRIVSLACNTDRRLGRFQDLFLLQPLMPIAGRWGTIELEAEAVRLNLAYRQLDWEIEDLLSESLHNQFAIETGHKPLSAITLGGKTHREYDRDAKRDLCKFVENKASLGQVKEVIALLRALRSYLGLDHEHIVA